MSTNPEIAKSIPAAGLATNYHDEGTGTPIVLLHASGPGVSAWANWRLTIPALAKQHRVRAPPARGQGSVPRHVSRAAPAVDRRTRASERGAKTPSPPNAHRPRPRGSDHSDLQRPPTPSGDRASAAARLRTLRALDPDRAQQ